LLEARDNVAWQDRRQPEVKPPPGLSVLPRERYTIATQIRVIKLEYSARAVSSMVEHFVYTEGAGGSSPSPPTTFGDRHHQASPNFPPIVY
jgi:hypothetical protein